MKNKVYLGMGVLKQKRFWIAFSILFILELVAFIPAFAHDEGTLGNDFIGGIATGVVVMFNFPLIYISNSINFSWGMFYIPVIIINILLWSWLIVTIMKLVKK